MIKKINNESEHAAALVRIDEIFEIEEEEMNETRLASLDSELRHLCKIVADYEDIHHQLDNI